MKIWLLALVFLINFCTISTAADNYCKELKKASLDGKYVVINPADGGERNFTHGVIVAVEPDMLVVKTGDSHSYINCAHIHSVVYTESAQQK